MLRYTEGNLLDAPVEALVNTVNTVGVMGKGIALQFKEEFPENFAAYKAACELEEVRVGRMFVTETERSEGPRWIVNFPTKTHWRQSSKLEYVETGLVDLMRVIHDLGIRSIAVPPLGCGNGGLDWNVVRSAIESALGELPDVDVLVYQPTATYRAAPKHTGALQLTVARATIVDLIRRYLVLGFDCTNLEVQKLAYLFQRVATGLELRDELKLTFKAHKYGPYADALRHLLDKLDGSYLHSEKRMADAGPFDVIRIDIERLERVDEYLSRQPGARYAAALETVDRLIDGFQSPYLMELLTTVDWIMRERGGATDTDAIVDEIGRWPGGDAAAQRKARLFDRDGVELAHARLVEHSAVLYPEPGRRAGAHPF